MMVPENYKPEKADPKPGIEYITLAKFSEIIGIEAMKIYNLCKSGAIDYAKNKCGTIIISKEILLNFNKILFYFC